MLIQHTIKYLYFFLILIYELLCYTKSSAHEIFDTKKSRLANEYTNYFYHLETIHNKTADEDYNKSVAGTEKKRLIKSIGA
ncbi:MAG: hypothetical protein OXC48_01500, partial [Endozoicomonadaceae bacterium]|nr:hypothetical protein [Endozoicomonadaceae bacterium]